jgi:putative ABC transport system permease protein
VEYLRNNALNLFSESEVNKEFNCGYKIPRGKFLMLFQYDLNDGYEHEMIVPDTVGFFCGNKNIELRSAGSDIRVLFNINPTFADTTLILNDADYSKIARKARISGRVLQRCILFIIGRIQKGNRRCSEFLRQINRVDKTRQKLFQGNIQDRSSYNSKQSAEFFIFLMLFIVALFCGHRHYNPFQNKVRIGRRAKNAVRSLPVRRNRERNAGSNTV